MCVFLRAHLLRLSDSGSDAPVNSRSTHFGIQKKNALKADRNDILGFFFMSCTWRMFLCRGRRHILSLNVIGSFSNVTSRLYFSLPCWYFAL